MFGNGDDMDLLFDANMPGLVACLLDGLWLKLGNVRYESMEEDDLADGESELELLLRELGLLSDKCCRPIKRNRHLFTSCGPKSINTKLTCYVSLRRFIFNVNVGPGCNLELLCPAKQTELDYN
jgi:hypothetical protein